MFKGTDDSSDFDSRSKWTIRQAQSCASTYTMHKISWCITKENNFRNMGLPGFTWVSLGFRGFLWVYLGLPGLPWVTRVTIYHLPSSRVRSSTTGGGKNSSRSHFWPSENYFFSVKIWENAPHGIAQKRTVAIFDISSGSWDKFLEFF